MTAVRWKKTLISADDFGIRVSVSLSGSRHGEVSEFYLQLRHCWELRRIRLYFWTQQLFSSTVSAVSREATHSAHRTGSLRDTYTRSARARRGRHRSLSVSQRYWRDRLSNHRGRGRSSVIYLARLRGLCPACPVPLTNDCTCGCGEVPRAALGVGISSSRARGASMDILALKHRASGPLSRSLSLARSLPFALSLALSLSHFSALLLARFVARAHTHPPGGRLARARPRPASLRGSPQTGPPHRAGGLLTLQGRLLPAHPTFVATWRRPPVRPQSAGAAAAAAHRWGAQATGRG